MKLCLISLIMLLTACAAPQMAIHPELQPYVDFFEQTYGQKVNYSVRLGNAQGIQAYCDHHKNYVMIDKNIFLVYNRPQRLELLLHEFGHCSFNREHLEGYIKAGPMAGCAKSLMTPNDSVTLSGCFEKFTEFYLQELPRGF